MKGVQCFISLRKEQILYKKDSELLTGISFFLLRKGRGIERKMMM